MKTQTKNIQDSLTPKDAYEILVEGNKRFLQGEKAERNLNNQVDETSDGQYPFAAILSCIDSRVPVELVFDQGIGDVFSVRVAGNIVNEDVLGSIEYSCKVAGSKLVIVMGHTKCGAVTAACNNVELGNITPLLQKIDPAIDSLGLTKGSNDIPVEKVAVENVKLSMDRIRNESQILSEMEKEGKIEILGAIYHVENGAVSFLEG